MYSSTMVDHAAEALIVVQLFAVTVGDARCIETKGLDDIRPCEILVEHRGSTDGLCLFENPYAL